MVVVLAVAGLVLDCTTFAAFHVWGRSPQRSVGSPSRSSGKPDEDEEERDYLDPKLPKVGAHPTSAPNPIRLHPARPRSATHWSYQRSMGNTKALPVRA